MNGPALTGRTRAVNQTFTIRWSNEDQAMCARTTCRAVSSVMSAIPWRDIKSERVTSGRVAATTRRCKHWTSIPPSM